MEKLLTLPQSHIKDEYVANNQQSSFSFVDIYADLKCSDMFVTASVLFANFRKLPRSSSFLL